MKKQKKEPAGLLIIIKANESPDYIGQVGKTWEEVDETVKQFLPVTIRGIECHALVDSGNLFRTCISEQLMNKLKIAKKDLIKLTQNVGTAKKGDTLQILGEIPHQLHIQLGDCPTRFKTRPVVIKDLNMPMNLSAKFLKMHNMCQAHGTGQLHAQGLKIPLLSRNEIGVQSISQSEADVYVQQEVTVPPYSEMIVSLQSELTNGEAILTGSFDFMHRTNLHPARNVLVTVKDCNLIGTVLNSTPDEIFLPKHARFGLARLVCAADAANQFPSRIPVGNIMSVDSSPETPSLLEKAKEESWAKGPTNPSNFRIRVKLLDQQFQLSQSPYLSNAKDKHQALRLLLQFWDCFSWDGEFGGCDLLFHEIHLTPGPPINQKIRPISPALEENLRKQIDEWLKHDVIEPSTSPWNFALVPVPKKDKRTRWCVDYRPLNNRTIKDSHPLGDITDNLNQLSGSKIFSTMDGTGAFHVVPLAKEAKPKTAFSTPWGHFQYKRLPFGLSNGPATYARLVQMVLQGLPRNRVVPYLDDVICHTTTLTDHLKSLAEIFQAYRAAGLKLQPKKCHFFKDRITYLGHTVSQKGIEPSPEHVEVVKSWPLPTTRTQVRAFLGKVGYYRRFIKDFAARARPLMDKLSQEEGVGDKDELKIDEPFRQSFQSLKQELLSFPILAYPDFKSNEMFILDTDWSASNCAIGAVLSQKQEGKERVIAYAAKRLNSTQQNYAPTKGELLAAVTFMRHFHYYLRYRKFILRTDHAALKYIRTMDPPKGTIARWLDCIANFEFEVVYREGKKHGNADALSRLENLDSRHETEDHKELISQLDFIQPQTFLQMQEKDDDLQLLIQCLKQHRIPDDLEKKKLTEEGLRYVTLLSSFFLKNNMLVHRKEGSMSTLPVIPSRLQDSIIRQAHILLSHKGPETTLEFLQRKVYFLGMKSKVERIIAMCNPCLTKTKPSTRGQHRVLHSHRPGEPWSVLAVDFVGPFPTSASGYKYLLTVKDTFTRWMEAFPTRDMTSDTVIKLLTEQVFSRYGMCARIHSDNGRQFISDLYHKLMSRFGIQVSQTPPYNPQSNPVERAHRDLEASLTALCQDKTTKWPDYLSQALFAQRVAICRSTGFQSLRAYVRAQSSL